MRVVAVIPARYASTRFPGKPLFEFLGKPMVQWVHERVSAAPGLAEVIVATEDERIAEVVRGFGGRVEMTSPDHPTGTDRLAEVAGRVDAEIIVNVQGDEPTVHPNCIPQLIAPLLADESLPMSTLRVLMDPADWDDPNMVKVVVDRRDRALYFSRSPIPHHRAGGVPAPLWKHIGLYAYRREFLLAFAQLAPTPLEQSETLEQLRALENGYAIGVATTEWNPLSVDVPEDVPGVLERLRAL